jgi:prepilin-type N-terminal cleavage/methylation domain-containing protein
MSGRRAFTLWEMTIVLALVALGTALVVPNWIDFGQGERETPGGAFAALLRDARRVAIQQSQTVAVRIDPSSMYYRIDTTGTAGTGLLVDGTLPMGTYESLETELPRLQYVFRPTGAALGDTVLLRGAEFTAMVAIDPWSGQAVFHAR